MPTSGEEPSSADDKKHGKKSTKKSSISIDDGAENDPKKQSTTQSLVSDASEHDPKKQSTKQSVMSIGHEADPKKQSTKQSIMSNGPETAKPSIKSGGSGSENDGKQLSSTASLIKPPPLPPVSRSSNNYSEKSSRASSSVDVQRKPKVGSVLQSSTPSKSLDPKDGADDAPKSSEVPFAPAFTASKMNVLSAPKDEVLASHHASEFLLSANEEEEENYPESFEEEDEFSELKEEEKEEEEKEEEKSIEKKEEVVETVKPPEPTFICHEATYNPQEALFATKKPKGTVSKGEGNANASDWDESEDDDEFYPRTTEKKTYTMTNPKDLEYRPAALTKFPAIVRQITDCAHKQLLKYGCQRFLPERVKPGQGRKSVAHHDKRVSHLKLPHESMERKLHRLKIYKRALSSIVIYFRPYSPIFFYIKKSYDDVLNFRLRQFKEAQHEKIRIFHERQSIENKIANYRFPDFKRLKKSEQYLGLLFTRIKKQDEAIKYVTEILSKMEQSLSDHFEKYRDLQDQIKLLDNEIAERMSRGMAPKKKHAPPLEQEAGGDAEGLSMMNMEDDEEEEPIDENEEINDDKKTVLCLAYAVCMKDLEEATKNVKMYENKYQDVAPRAALSSTRLTILDEEAQVDVLISTLETLEQDFIDITVAETAADRELAELATIPEDERIEIIKKKLAAMEAQERGEMEEAEDDEMSGDEEEEEDNEEEMEAN